MKRSTRLIFRTIAAVHVLMVLSIVTSRLLAVDVDTELAAATTPQALAQLRDFTVIRAMGDFDIEIVQQPDYSIEFSAGPQSTAVFRAAIRQQGVLSVFATNSPAGDHLRIGMPELRQVAISRVSLLTISGFSGDSMLLRNDGDATAELRNNDIAQWTISAGSPFYVKFDRASMDDSRIHVNGQGTISVLE